MRNLAKPAGVIASVVAILITTLSVVARKPPPILPTLAADSFAGSMQSAGQFRTRALLAAVRRLEAIDEWDPGITARVTADALRRELLARDADGDLKHSLVLARQAAEVAATPQERYRATLLIARIKCDSGDHEGEFQTAMELMVLAPGADRSRLEMRHAEQCRARELPGRPALAGL